MRSLLFLAPAILASPLVKRYDIDGNGIPDMCKELGNGKAECVLSGGGMTTIPSTMSATAAAAGADQTFTATESGTTYVIIVEETGSAPPAQKTGSTPSTKPTSTVFITRTTSLASAKTASPAVPALNSTVHAASNSTSGTSSNGTTIPCGDAWKKDKGSKWTMTLMPGTDAKQQLPEGSVFSSTVNRLGWDKGRTSTIDNKTFWNFGDCLSVDGIDKGSAAGWSMGAAFYASTANPLEVDMAGMTSVSGQDFAKPWTGSPNPDPALPSGESWGMDTSNTAQVAPGKGIGFAWEIFRDGAHPDGKDLGNAMFEVTLGADKPIATRTQGLITDGSKIQIGLMTVFNPNLIPNAPGADGFLYMYTTSPGTWDSVIVGRVPVADAFAPSKYQFMKKDGSWDAAGTIPDVKDAGSKYGMAGSPVSNSQGSIMWNEFLGQYVLFCGTMGASAAFYTAPKPYGPWSEAHWLLDSTDGEMRYGSNVHPALLPGSSGKEMLWSWGTAGVQTMYKITLNY